ncbi:MAG TPA: hypothetical protein VNO30_01355 [Kofleriaceae bacterium]|nr:hypothetical protein [Kofleriaceae bacterium]
MTAARNAPGHARRITAVLRSVLPPKVRLEVAKSHGPNIDLKIAGHRIGALWAGSGSLGPTRSALETSTRPPDVVVARQMSPGARELLSGRGIGWVDELGAAEIALGTIVVSRTGRRPEPAKKPSGWTPAVLAVSEALLHGTRATVASMREATGLSSGSCANALRVLTELRLLEADAQRGRASARRVVSTDGLLEAYASAAVTLKPPGSLTVGVTWRDHVAGLAELGQRWTQLGIDWAATGAVAAAVLAPLLTTVSSTTVYVDARTSAELEAIAARADLRPIEGGRLTLAPFPTVTTRLLAEPIAGIRLAPWPRVYVDLRATGVRGEEAAEHLLEVMRGR